LEIFKHLHPKTYAGWTVEITGNYLQKILEYDKKCYLGALTKPHTLRLIEQFDSANATNFAKPSRDLFLTLAIFGAVLDGKVSEEKEAEIERLKSLLEPSA
jgi:hypothetical protein